MFVSLLSDAWYKRSEQENAGGIWKSRVFVFLSVCVRAFVCPLALCLQFEVNRLVCIQLLSLCVPKLASPDPPDHNLSLSVFHFSSFTSILYQTIAFFTFLSLSL